MGENQSKPSSKNTSSPTRPIGASPGPNQQSFQGVSDEEVRRRRLERMEKPPEWRDRPQQKAVQANTVFRHPLAQNNDNVFLPPDHVGVTGSVQRDVQEQIVILQKEAALNKEITSSHASHPVNQAHGKEAYIIHASIEDLLELTIYRISIVRNSKLRLIEVPQGQDSGLQLFAIKNFAEVIQILLESKVYINSNEKLGYLCKVLSRLEDLDKSSAISDSEKKELRIRLNSFISTYLTCPQIYSPDYKQENIDNAQDFSCVLYDSLYTYLATSHEKGDFLPNFVADLDYDNFDAIFTPLFKRIIMNSTSSSLENTQKLMEAVQLFEELLHADKRVIEFLVTHSLFIPKTKDATGLDFQKKTIFGAFLTLTSLPTESEWTHTYFADSKNIKNNNHMLAQLRAKIHAPLDCLQRILEHMMKADQRFKQSIVEWFYRVIEINEAKTPDGARKNVCTNGWYINFFVLLLKLSEKVLEDPTKYPNWFSKISLQYLKEKPIFNNTKLLNGQINVCNSGEVQEESSPASPSKAKYTFLTELIFLISHALSLLINVGRPYDLFIVTYSVQMTQIKQGSPEHYKWHGKKFAYDVQLFDPYLVAQVTKLIMFQSLLIIHSYEIPMTNLESFEQLFEATASINNSQFQDKLSLPFYWAENMYHYFFFACQRSYETVLKSKQQFETIMIFFLSVIGNPNWIPDLKLRANFLCILAILTPLRDKLNDAKADLGSFLFKQNQYFEKHLVRSLVQFCTELENMVTKQPYDRFASKFHCCRILHYLAKSLFAPGKVSYIGSALDIVARDHREVYLKFAKVFVNDMIYLMNDFFMKIKQIKEYEDDLLNPALMDLLAPAEKQRRKTLNDAWIKNVESVLIYVNTYFEMAVWLTQISPEIFRVKEIQQLLATSLNYSLLQLNGPHAMDLKVDALKNMKFDSKALLKMIVQVYLNFGDDERFVAAVVRDKRSFNIDLFNKSINVVSQFSLLFPDDFTKFVKFVANLENKIQEKKTTETATPEIQRTIPNKFLDPITREIMNDPVLLPTSNMLCDRTTIMDYLVSGNTDPFNGEELTESMLVPQNALKMAIREFLEGKDEQ